MRYNFQVALLFICFLFSFHHEAIAQYRITGKVVDSLSHLPIPYVTVTVKSQTKDAPRFSLTDSIGHFSVNVPKHDTLSVIFVSVGYQTKNVRLLLAPDQSQNYPIGVINLIPQSNRLKEVSITATKPLIKQEVDRLTYDVQTDADSKTLSVLELINKVPLLSVDGEENIKLKGSGNYRIFINGRPSALVANNPKDALKAMPANTVAKIEVITTPPAKYDAEGLAGIINIVMIKRTQDGYNGTVGISYNNAVGTGENATLIGKKGKFGLTSRLYTYQDVRQSLTKQSYRRSLVPVYSDLFQQGEYEFVGNYRSGNFELSFEADSLNLLTTSLNFSGSHYDDHTAQTSVKTGIEGQTLQAYRSSNVNPQDENTFDLDVNYQLGFRRHKDRLLTASFQLHNAPIQQSNETLIDERLNFSTPSYRQMNQNSTKEQTYQLDYVHPSKFISLDGGIKAILRNSHSDFTNQTFDPNINEYVEASAMDNRFDYDQNIYSAYSSGRLNLKWVNIQAGVRLEHTVVNADFLSQNTQLDTRYTNLIPVITLLHQFKQSSVNIGFTQRISRPGIYQLNPFVERTDPQFVSTGNPNLKAVINNSFTASYSNYGKGSYNVSLSYAYSTNSIQRVTTLTDEVSYSTYQNVGKNRSAGLNTSLSYPLTKLFAASVNTELTYLWLSGEYNGKSYTNSGLQGFGYTNLTYKFASTWRTTASLTFVSTNINLQGSTNAYWFNSYRLTKDAFGKKLTITGGLSNPFNTYRYVRSTIDTEDFNQLVINQRRHRMFTLGVTYNFGNLKSEIKKNQRSIKNDDLTGSAN